MYPGYAFSLEIVDIMLCSSQCIISVARDLDLSMVGDSHFDHFIRMMSASLLHYTVSPFITDMHFVGSYFKIFPSSSNSRCGYSAWTHGFLVY